ncbi:MAG: hypothetical protein ABR562_05580, partial [Thermoplasmatota archaeon]
MESEAFTPYQRGVLDAIALVGEYRAIMAEAARKPHPAHGKLNTIALSKLDAAESMLPKLRGLLLRALNGRGGEGTGVARLLG